MKYVYILSSMSRKRSHGHTCDHVTKTVNTEVSFWGKRWSCAGKCVSLQLESKTSRKDMDQK